MQKTYPDFFIVGAPRCGTTSLHEYLNQIPDVFMCTKECGFFSTYSNGRVESYDEYYNLFSTAESNQLIGESTAIYLRDPETPKKIYQANPNAKIIFMLRDPIERAFSHYLMYVKNGYENLPFSKKLEKYIENKANDNFHNYIIMPSYYFNSINEYIRIFGKDNVKIIIYEEFAKKTKKIVTEILDFLNLDVELPTNLSKKYNDFSHPLGKSQNFIISNKLSKTLGKKFLPKSTRVSIKNLLSDKKSKPELTQNDISKLSNLFNVDVKNIQNLISNKLEWKNFPETL